jgi:metal-responsive CopG/Arc/MetJ family transcriptional regulator
MQTIQVVLDEPLLQATNRAAKRSKVNRSALVREALRLYLKAMAVRELERRDRAGYERHPDTGEDLELWEKAAVWPDQ